MQNPIVTFETTRGTIKAELYPEIAPNTVNNFISLIQKGFYDGTIFHRVIPGFMIQGGDPEGTGMGGPGYGIKGEFAMNGFKNAKQHLNKTFLAREICDCSDLCRRHDLTVHVAGLNHELTVGILCKLVQDSCRSDLILVGNSQSGCAFENLGHTLDLGAFDSTLEKSILNDSVLNAGFTQFLTELCIGLCSDTLVVYDNTGYAVSDLILQLSNNCLLCFQNAFTGQNIHLAFQL